MANLNFVTCVLLLFLGTGILPGQEGQLLKEVWIPMDDGTRLAADLYMPAGVENGERYPVVLEYLPYRKDEGRTHRYPLFSYFTGHGYVVARVDIRGTGRSEGKLVDGEYSEQELQDGEQVIQWLSRQGFSTGAVAMLGISWGGFNGLQLAMRRPEALKTVISLMSTDDLYQDDVHFIDGMMHIDAYEIGQDLANALPQAPDYPVDEAYFKNRFDTRPWLLKYKEQQTSGPFWDRASLKKDYTAIDVPLFVIGGWYDGYRDFIPRILREADVPVKALLGPWNHTWPNWADPGPAVEWRQLAVRWLDHWMKDKDTGVMEEASVYYYQRGWHPPGGDLGFIPGQWRQSGGWPETRDSLFYMQGGGKLGEKPHTFTDSLNYVPTEGVAASGSVMWWGDWAPDQQEADAKSLAYETQPLADSLEILGFPAVSLRVSSSARAANWFVRLSDVAPDGSVTQVTGAGFNGRHLRSAEEPEPLVIDSVYTIPIELHATSWTFLPGHRIRIAINNAQWPMIWPTPYRMQTKLESDPQHPSFLSLPVSLQASPLAEGYFPKPATDPQLPGYTSLESATVSGFAEVDEVVRDEDSMTTTVVARNSGGDQYPWAKVYYSEEIAHQLGDKNPSEAEVQSTYIITVEQEGRRLVLTGILDFRSDLDSYHYRYTRRLEENGVQLREKSWEQSIPRE